MIGIIILFIALGLGCGLWGEFSEQRRLGRAAAVMRGTSITAGDSSDTAQERKERRHV